MLAARRLAAAAARNPLVRARASSPLAPPARACTTGIDEDKYHRLASCTLEGLQEVYEDLADDEPDLAMEVEYADGVLNVIVGTQGTFVINKQAPNRQIWLSSPVTGPLRYDFCRASEAWLSSRDQHELLGRLADDFDALASMRPDFGRVAEEIANEVAGS